MKFDGSRYVVVTDSHLGKTGQVIEDISGNGHHGVIRDVKVGDRTLLPDEVRALHAESKGG